MLNEHVFSSSGRLYLRAGKRPHRAGIPPFSIYLFLINLLFLIPLIFYGQTVLCTGFSPEPAMNQAVQKLNMDHFTGVNLRREDPVQYLDCAGFVREYHDGVITRMEPNRKDGIKTTAVIQEEGLQGFEFADDHYVIEAISLFDIAGQGIVSIALDNDLNDNNGFLYETTYATVYYQEWHTIPIAIAPLANNIRRIVLQKQDGDAKIGRIKLYGHPDPGTPEQFLRTVEKVPKIQTTLLPRCLTKYDLAGKVSFVYARVVY